MSVFASKRMFYLLILAFLAGACIAISFSDSSFFQNGYFNVYALERLQYIEIDENKLFLCILQNRMQLLFIALILGTTIIGSFAGYLFVAWYGLCLGIMMTIFVERFGVKGCLLFLACVFPQILLYIPGFYGMIHECIWFGRMNRAHILTSGREKLLKHIVKCVFSVGAVIIGILLESYVNPYIVSKIVLFLKYL